MILCLSNLTAFQDTYSNAQSSNVKHPSAQTSDLMSYEDSFISSCRTSYYELSTVGTFSDGRSL